MLSYEDARRRVIEVAQQRGASRRRPQPETLNIARDPSSALGRVLAEAVVADRDYPPFDRSIRDGFAVRAADVAAPPVTLSLIGESKAGTAFDGRVEAGQCVQIMTGAPVPAGADAVVMIEHTHVSGSAIRIERAARRGDHIVCAGSEARARTTLIQQGTRLGFAELAVAAQTGDVELKLYPKPRVAILSTGDEIVAADQAPGPFEIRNSNSVSLAAQVSLAGAYPVPLGNAPDRVEELRKHIELGLKEDVLVLTGGVSMGKYDLVETVLHELGMEFYFDAVAIRPGRPAVFGAWRDRLIFGLPGNPVSTMVTFEVLVVPALDMFGGAPPRPLALFKAKLKHDLSEKPGLAHFLPARVSFSTEGACVETVPWQGSGDIAALAKANCFLVASAFQGEVAAGEYVDVLPRRGLS